MSSINAPDPKAPAIWGSIWSIWGLSGLVVLLRLHARRLRRLDWAADDWMAVVALFFSFCVCIASSLAARYGVGKHIWDVSTEDVENWNKSLFYGNIVYISTGPSMKISALLMYRRVFAAPKFGIASLVVVAVCVAWWIAEIIGCVLNCIPVSGFWDKSIKASCVSTFAFDLQYATINIVLDLIILAMPIRMVLGLQLSQIQKLAFVLLFSIGGFATVAAVIRMIIFIRNLGSDDETYVWYEGVIWSCLEPCIGVISICLPLLQPVFLTYLPKRLRDSLASKTGQIFKGKIARSLRPMATLQTLSRRKDGWRSSNNGTTQDGSFFVHLEGNDVPLETIDGRYEAYAVGSGLPDGVDPEQGRGQDGIVRRTDITLEVERSK